MNRRGAAEQVELSELTERAAGMLDSALAAGDSQGIADAVSLFEDVESVCSRGPHAEYWKSVVNLADALIKQAEADGRTAPSIVHWTSLMPTSSTSELAISRSVSSSGRAKRCC